MIEQVKKQIARHSLLEAHHKVLVGLSGGPDSMVLIHVLMQLGYRCIAAHCNFHLRGEASNSDAAFVKKWCQQNNIPCYTIDFDTEEYATTHRLSIEMAARELRYNWFNKMKHTHHCHAIAVGHHQDDSVETILINLIRGTGIKGLTGIPPKNNSVVRPLLSITQQQIMEYLAQHNLPHVIDRTNHEDIYTRNILRLNVLPTLEKINPSVRESIIRTSHLLQESQMIYDAHIQEIIKRAYRNNKIEIATLQNSPSPQSVLFELLSPLGFTPSVIEDIATNLHSIPGKIYLSSTYRLLKDRDYLIVAPLQDDKESHEEYLIYPNSKNDHYPQLPFRLEVESHNYTSQFKIVKDPSIIYLDDQAVQFPLKLRRWQKGDWFIPFGMKGKKKLSDFFTDNKFSLFQKEETWVLLSAQDIVWVVNHRADNRFKISHQTQKVHAIQLFKQS